MSSFILGWFLASYPGEKLSSVLRSWVVVNKQDQGNTQSGQGRDHHSHDAVLICHVVLLALPFFFPCLLDFAFQLTHPDLSLLWIEYTKPNVLQDHRVMFTDFIKSLYRERERERERDKKLCKILSGGQYGRDHVSKVIRPFIIMLPRISQKIAYRWIGAW